MKLTDCIALLLRAKALPDLVQAARHVGCTSGTEAEVKSAWEALRVHLAANDHRPAVATALALLWLDPDGAIRRMRKEGLLRASRYRYTAACIRKVAGAALELADELALSPERRDYVSSVLALTGIAGGTKQLYRSLVDRLSTRHQFGMKTLMAKVNSAFAVNHPGEPTGDSRTLDYWNATCDALE